MRAIYSFADVQQVLKDLQDQFKKNTTDLINNAINALNINGQLNGINPAKFYIGSEVGANNAIQGALPVPLTVGMVVEILLKHTLQIGANTFNAAPIKSHRNIASNIAAGYSVGSIVQLCWDGTNWQDLSQ